MLHTIYSIHIYICIYIYILTLYLWIHYISDTVLGFLIPGSRLRVRGWRPGSKKKDVQRSLATTSSISSYNIPYHTIPYHTILYHTILYHTIRYYTIPYYTMGGLPGNGATLGALLLTWHVEREPHHEPLACS